MQVFEKTVSHVLKIGQKDNLCKMVFNKGAWTSFSYQGVTLPKHSTKFEEEISPSDYFIFG
jgi:hypothetical protein